MSTEPPPKGVMLERDEFHKLLDLLEMAAKASSSAYQLLKELGQKAYGEPPAPPESTP